MTKHALVPIADGIEEIEAVCIIDTLRRGGMQVTVASVDRLQIVASRGVSLVADALIGECAGRAFDLIALPGGMPGAEHLRDTPTLIELLKKQQEEKRWIGAICASPVVVLQHHGILVGRKATCHPSFADQLEDDEAVEKRVVVDQGCITSRGPGTAIEFALKCIELLLGREQAQKIAVPMMVQ